MSSLDLTFDQAGASAPARPPFRQTPLAAAVQAPSSPTYRPGGRSPVGIAVAVVAHVLLGWALINGLGRTVVDAVIAPIETRLIEEFKPPPPPPPPVERAQPPKAVKPPPAYVPPPEVRVTPPPQAAPTITTTQVAPPPEPVVVAAPAPPAPPPPAPARAVGTPARIDVSSCEKPEYPTAAARVEAAGTTKIRFAVDATGAVSKADVERSSGSSREHRLLDRTAVAALSKCRFVPGLDEHGQPAGGFAVVDYVWKFD